MHEVRIDNLLDYIGLIAGLSDRSVYYRGAKDPVEDMRPTVVRSWMRNRRIREDRCEKSRLGLWDYERRLIESFQRQSLPFLEAIPDCHLNWLAVAQHHQLPTRLLDWTRNPLIALYFAATNRTSYAPAPDWDEVYVFMWDLAETPDAHRHILTLDRVRAMRPGADGVLEDEGEAPRGGVWLFSPPIISSRFATQEGLFSVERQLSEAAFPELADRAGLELTRIAIPGAARFEILKHLNRLGVETGKLFPDLPGLCAHQKWVAEWLW